MHVLVLLRQMLIGRLEGVAHLGVEIGLGRVTIMGLGPLLVPVQMVRLSLRRRAKADIPVSSKRNRSKS